MKCLGIDVGGTFTDLVFFDEESGETKIEKVPSTPHDHSEGMLGGMERLELKVDLLEKVVHGTTVATNTALERSGAKIAMIVTRGFRDVLTVGRGNRTDLYNVRATRAAPFIPRSLCFEVDERTLHNGVQKDKLDSRRVAELSDHLNTLDIESVAVCFLHSYANDENEQTAMQALIEKMPGLFVSTSSEVLAEFREFERFATTAVNAYVAPRMRRYLSALEKRMALKGNAREIQIMTSNGGTITTSQAAKFPVQTMLSGPAGGVIGAVHVCAKSGYPNIITYDMGGTSTDVCLVEDFEYRMTNEGEIGDLPNRTLQIDINTVGAGGGSVAAVDADGFMTVGPQSAGARPGPACYGHGGSLPTVTDANVVLSRLAPSQVLGGEIRLDRSMAESVIAPLAERLGVNLPHMAEGIVKLAVTRMASAIKEISVMHGYDPREFALFAFGGAGPLHAAAVADELGIRTVVVPPMPGNFSAFGLLVADSRLDAVQTDLRVLSNATIDDIRAVLDDMKARVKSQLMADGYSESAIRLNVRLDMRFIGQSFELPVQVNDFPTSIQEIADAFTAAYGRRYAYVSNDPIEIVNFRVSGFGKSAKPTLSLQNDPAESLEDAVLGRRPVVFNGVSADTPVYHRDRIPESDRITGPAIIEENGATTVVPPNATAWIDPDLNLIISLG